MRCLTVYLCLIFFGAGLLVAEAASELGCPVWNLGRKACCCGADCKCCPCCKGYKGCCPKEDQ